LIAARWAGPAIFRACCRCTRSARRSSPAAIFPAAEAYRLGAVEKVVPRADLVGEARAFCAVIASKSRKALVIAKEALNGLEPRDVDRGYRWEQGFTLEMYMHEDSQKSRDAFVETGKVAKF
jgi:enoyl-CoA hydratase